jgi:hypothetical protein
MTTQPTAPPAAAGQSHGQADLDMHPTVGVRRYTSRHHVWTLPGPAVDLLAHHLRSRTGEPGRSGPVDLHPDGAWPHPDYRGFDIRDADEDTRLYRWTIGWGHIQRIRHPHDTVSDWWPDPGRHLETMIARLYHDHAAIPRADHTWTLLVMHGALPGVGEPQERWYHRFTDPLTLGRR